MSRYDTTFVARDLIDAALPIHPEHSEAVRAVVGSKWSYSAGTFDLRPEKRISRRLDLNQHTQRLRFDDLYLSLFGVNEIHAVFLDDAMLTEINSRLTHEGKISIIQSPKEVSLEFPQITTTDVGRMMLANGLLYEQGVADFRPPKLHIASALLNLSAATL